MNPPEILGSQVGEDPQNFIDKVRKIFGVMQVTSNDMVELASYQLNDVAHIWFTQLKENKSVGATPDQYSRAPGSKSQGSVSGNKTYPNCPKCSKNHPRECLADKEGCFGCGQSGHWVKNYLSTRQGQDGKSTWAQSTVPTTPIGHPTQQDMSSGTGSG
ncbi:uncharacterized protein LOC125833328 [Solanum verrucosum]|uniref:uncharacterized protein LOC125833328 n=1 Tax=Solanum verrucosum TaxID=315347 RepID=UPI0020D0B415|nr:uncharacterized protein LOC125833328 [Solanum verrucosum]